MGDKGFGDHARDFLRNIREDQSGAARKSWRVVRNRFRATLRGCCGRPGEAGC